MKIFRTFITCAILLLMVLCLCAFQSTGEDGPILTNPKNDPALTMNPMTGTPLSGTDLLTMPPVFVPLARYPSAFRPSSGHSEAQWVWEMYVADEESRPILMFYGEKPTGSIARISSAIYGLEALRNQYGGVIIAGGTSKSILESEIYNLELWYGTTFDQLYPELPLENYEKIINKWSKLITPADPNNLTYNFSEEAPEGGHTANSLFFRYASTNQILWRYDESTGKYVRLQNSVENPMSLEADVDKNSGNQIAVDNLIILMAPHVWAPDQDPAYGLFTVQLNYMPSQPALIFRNGKVYSATWTTVSEKFERESQRMRPIRFLDNNGNAFLLKPGQTWVHIVMPGNPCYEVEAELGSVMTPGSGYWKLPYISFKPGSYEQVQAEVEELRAIELRLMEGYLQEVTKE